MQNLKPTIKYGFMRKEIVFGKKIKDLRAKAGLTQPQLASSSGVATSIVNDIENGIRSAGCKTVNKIALGLRLDEQERFLLVLKGLEFSKRDFLIPDFEQYPPELLNFLPYVLNRAGITAKSIRNIELPAGGKKNLEITLESKRKIQLDIRVITNT